MMSRLILTVLCLSTALHCEARAASLPSRSQYLQLHSLRARDESQPSSSCPIGGEQGIEEFYNQPNPTNSSKPLCKRGGCFSTPLEDTDGLNLPNVLDSDAAQYWKLGDVEGPPMVDKLTSYVSQGKNRPTAQESQEEQARFDKNYKKFSEDQPERGSWQKFSPDFDKYWPQAVGTNGPDVSQTGWKKINYYSSDVEPKHQESGQSIISLVGHAELGILVVYRAFKACDENEPAFKVYTSTLVWNAWKEIAEARQAIRKLKYIVFLDIVNRETDRLTSVAHELFPENVDFRGRDPTGPFWGDRTLPAYTGHGKWTPKDRAWTFIMGTPLVKGAANALMDVSV